MSLWQTQRDILKAVIHKIVDEQSFDDLIIMLENIADERADDLQSQNGAAAKRWKLLALSVTTAAQVRT